METAGDLLVGGKHRGRGSSAVHLFAVYKAFIRNAFLNMLAYRLRYFTGIITYLLFVSVHYFIWNAVYAGQPDGILIKGFTLPEMLTYVSVAWVARSLYFSNIDYEINELVRSGEISLYLLRPVQFHVIMLAQAVGESLFRLLFFTIPISAVVLALFPVMVPPSVSAGIGFLLATGFSFLILAEINFLVGLLSFYITSIEGVMRAKYFLIQLLSGLLLPLTFFPGLFGQVVESLPFKLISYVPLQMYLGKIPGSEMQAIFLEEIVWLLVLVVCSQVMWKRAVAKLTLQGG